ncbi:MAG: TonB-dependent receptor [Candidatus Erginobacter occultus]|nr:TonB-dependent receptor [Candidatus Erginobacter occultus]
MRKLRSIPVFWTAVLAAAILSAGPAAGEEWELAPVVIREELPPDSPPAGTWSGPLPELRFDPRVDLQVRNSAAASADCSIQGGIFTQSGFRAGAATLLDPQTGHYSSEIPIAPLFLAPPRVLGGLDNSLSGFNAAAGTVAYGWSRVDPGWSAGAGWGTRGFNSQRVSAGYLAPAPKFLSGAADEIGLDLDLARAAGDGTRPDGDFDFQRFGGRLQLSSGRSQTDLFAGYGKKFFGWPDMYTPEELIPSAETESLYTTVVFLNHRRRYSEENLFELSGYYRKNSDHYVLQRDDPDLYQAFHRTVVWSAAASGRHDFGPLALDYSGQLTADRLDSTTLTFSPYYSRTLGKVALLPEKTVALKEDLDLVLSAGAGLDLSNRSGDRLSPLAGAELVRRPRGGGRDRCFLSYGAASQLPDYTALGSPPGGLFGGNPDLGRERSRTVEAAFELDRGGWRLEGSVFYRADRDLVDWTYNRETVNARTADAVDLDTRGAEAVFSRAWKNLRLRLGYAWLEKSGRYRDPEARASFYALNYPRHRGLVSLAWSFLDRFEFRLENEYRRQRSNPLRSGPEEVILTAAALAYLPSFLPGLESVLSVDNPFKVNFQEIPGVPGPGRQVILRGIYQY